MVKQIEVSGEQIIVGGNGYLVASESQPGAWHVVKASKCDCRGFEFRGRCRHLAAIAELAAINQVASRSESVALRWLQTAA